MSKKFLLVVIAAFLIPTIWVSLKKIIQSDKTTNVIVLEGEEVAYFSGGCFWCTEKDFESLPGVREVVSGYLGGTVIDPTYDQVASGNTDHREGVAVYYDPERISFEMLVDHHFKTHDPTDPGGSFYDRGFQYTSAIYYQDEVEKEIIELQIDELSSQFLEPVVTSVEEFTTFFVAEDYHQDFYKHNPIRYKTYRLASGRDAFIDSVWDSDNTGESLNQQEGSGIANNQWENFIKPSDIILRQILSPLSYYVTQENGTEPAFTEGNMHDKNESGIYVDIVSGEPLYSSTDKFDSGTGWPSFSKTIDDQFVSYHADNRFFMKRTEIRSRYGDSHLGHIFADNPLSETGMRHCINGAALRFIPVADMASQGYEEYLYLFDNQVGQE